MAKLSQQSSTTSTAETASPEFYTSIITTRTYSERLQTLSYVRDSGMKICSVGILGMGESLDDRANLLIQLANLPEHPE